MIRIFCDASFSWTANLHSKIKQGKIAYKIGNKEVKIEEVKVEEIPNLQQYTNLMELLSVSVALKNTQSKNVCVFSDSQVVCGWIEKRKNLSFLSKQHQKVMGKITERIDKMNQFYISWVPREFNIAGIWLDLNEGIIKKEEAEKMLLEVKKEKINIPKPLLKFSLFD